MIYVCLSRMMLLFRQITEVYAAITGGTLLSSPIPFSKGDIIFCLLSDYAKYFTLTSERDIHLFLINTESFYAHKDQDGKINGALALTSNPLTILDYQANNIKYIRTHRPQVRIKYLPYTDSIPLRSYYKPSSREKDIDVLFYGTLNERRRKIIDELSSFCRVQRVSFDDVGTQNMWLKRSRIVLDLYFYENNKVFDYYRMSYLLSNGIFTIMEEPEAIDYKLEPQLKNYYDYIIAVKYEQLVPTIRNFLAKSNEELQRYALKAQTWFQKAFQMEACIRDLITQTRIRPLVSEDYETYLPLVKQLSHYDHPGTKEDFEVYLRKYSEDVRIFVLPDGKELLAAATVFLLKKAHTNPIAQIEDVVVREDLRGRGYGKLLIDYLVDYIQRESCAYKIVLNSNENNLIFYEKCGFQPVAHQCKYML